MKTESGLAVRGEVGQGGEGDAKRIREPSGARPLITRRMRGH